MWGLDSFVIFRPVRRQYPDRVLLIRLDAIGDFILWASAAQKLVSHYHAQSKRVLLVANAVWARWAKQLAIFDDVIDVDRKRFAHGILYRSQILSLIREAGCKIAVCPAYSREWLMGDSVIRTCGASERIGSTGDTSNIQSWQKSISNHWYSRLIDAGPSPCSELIRNAEFVRGLCGIPFAAKILNLRELTPLRLSKSIATSINAEKPFYILFPGASWTGKRWPAGNFIQIAGRMHEKTGWHGVLCGGNEDVDLARRICNEARAPLVDLCGKTDLAELSAVIAQSRLVVSNDTSAVHFAAAAGVPVVCILGGGHYSRFIPYEIEEVTSQSLPASVIHPMTCFGCNWKCIYDLPNGSPMPCIGRISVDDVWRTIEQSLMVIPPLHLPDPSSPSISEI